MDGEDRIVRAALPAAIDDFLAAALHLGVFALHGSEVERLLVALRAAGGRGAAAEADAHGGPAEHDETRPRCDGGFGDLVGADVAHPAGDHDGFVVTVDPGSVASVGTGPRTGVARSRGTLGFCNEVAGGAFAVRIRRSGVCVGPGAGAGSDPAASRSPAVASFGALAIPLGSEYLKVHFEGTEVAAKGRASEFVVECGGADRAVEHDLKGGGDV